MILNFITASLLIACLAMPLLAADDDSSPPIHHEGHTALSIGEREVLLYRHGGADLFKPYVKELRTPAGLNVLVDSPPDHIHHHGLMLAFGLEDTDFWGEEPPNEVGRQRPGRLTVDEHALAHDTDWVVPGGAVVVRESRSIRIHESAGQTCNLLTWRSTMQPAGEAEVRLWGRHYFGLGMRFIHAMDGGAFIVPPESDGKPYRGDERLTRSRWCAYHADIEGRPVTVAMFDHPLNPRYPATWFSMSQPFAYLAATPNLEAQPRTLRPGESFAQTVGIALWDVHTEPDDIERAYEGWLQQLPHAPNLVNVGLAEHGTTVHASSAFGPDYKGERAIDGRTLVRETDKWNSAANVTPHYLRLDLGVEREIHRIVVRHEGALPLLDASRYNTADYRLQVAPKAWGPWRDIAERRGNTDNVTHHDVDAVRTRYLRLLIETAASQGRNDYGRIVELEVYSPSP
jgi:hypothetical protein